MLQGVRQSRVFRFVIVGIANTAFDFGVLYILVLAGVPYLWANMVSTSAALALSFALNRSYTFEASGKVWPQVLKFLMFTIFGLWVLQPLVMHLVFLVTPGSPENFLPLAFAKACATVVSMTWNFLTYDRFVFKPPRRHVNGS